MRHRRSDRLCYKWALRRKLTMQRLPVAAHGIRFDSSSHVFCQIVVIEGRRGRRTIHLPTVDHDFTEAGLGPHVLTPPLQATEIALTP